MKVLLCLMATIAACNAGFLGGQGGASVNQVQVQPQQLHHVESVVSAPVQHIQSAPEPEVKIIKIQNIGNGGGGYANGNGGGYSYNSGYSGASHGQPQIIKIIHEQAPSQGRYAPSYSNSNYKNSLESILPQILQIINEDSGADSAAYRNQLINVYGTSGRATITKGGDSADYLRGGRVVEKGHLQVMKVDRQNGQWNAGGRGGGNGGGHGGLGGLGGALSGLSSLFSGKW